MPNTTLPPRPSLEYLRKTAKERLAVMRRTDSHAQLADALLAVAQEHGFSSWRALKAEVDHRAFTTGERFIAACRQGDVRALRALLADEPSLVRAWDTDLTTEGLHGPGHDATGIHFAARNGHVDAVRALLDAGADPVAAGDVTGLGVIGWATCFLPIDKIPIEVVSLLLERGARHHIFSAIAMGDPDLVRMVVEQSPEALDRRMSRGEHGQTPLHFAISRGGDLLGLLIELGADVEAADANGETPLQFAMLRGDRKAVARLLDAGAARPQAQEAPAAAPSHGTVGASVQGLTPVLHVRNAAATLRWYVALGFAEVGRYPTDGTTVYWGMVSLGGASLMFEPGAPDGASATLLFATNRIRDQYRAFKAVQLAAAEADIAGEEGGRLRVEFVDDLHEPPFGGLRFSIRDCNGYTLQFLQEGKHSDESGGATTRPAEAL